MSVSLVLVSGCEPRVVWFHVKNPGIFNSTVFGGRDKAGLEDIYGGYNGMELFYIMIPYLF